jgi:hypothetical protein
VHAFTVYILNKSTARTTREHIPWTLGDYLAGMGELAWILQTWIPQRL